VEQLRVHVRNLGMLGVNGATDSKGRVELFERGYGKDAAGIAREAIAFGASFTLLRFLLPTSTRTQQRIMILMSSSSTLRVACRITRCVSSHLLWICADPRYAAADARPC
jgi:signal recognition particle receptor subunit alpha